MRGDAIKVRDADGLLILVEHLLTYSSLSAATVKHAKKLLLVESLRSIEVRPMVRSLDNLPPVGFWYSDSATGSTIVALLNMSDAPCDLAVLLTDDTLPEAGPSSAFRVCPYDLEDVSPQSAALCRCSTHEIFSGNELVNGQLHVRVPASAVISLVVSGTSDTVAGSGTESG